MALWTSATMVILLLLACGTARLVAAAAASEGSLRKLASNANTNTTTATAAAYFQNTYDSSPATTDASTLESLSPHIPWGDLNIVVVTDVHSWIAGNHQDHPRHWPYDGHRQPNQDADYGDVLSFYQNLQGLVQDHNNQDDHGTQRDLFFVMNGDFVDGTGLSSFPPTHLLPLLHHMPWDAINVGNHELYHDETIRFLTKAQQQQQQQRNATVPIFSRWKPGGYLSSNTVFTETNQPLVGHRYTYLEGKHTNTTLLAFGFLYDFHEGGPSSTNLAVEDIVGQDWFRTLLGQQAPVRPVDGILVLAHMDCLHPLVQVLLEGIRSALPLDRRDSVPIQFLTGHTHRRCHAPLDATAESFEAGRFLDTIGFVSWDIPKNHDTERIGEHNPNTNNFQHRFWDANRKSLSTILTLAASQNDNSTTIMVNDDIKDFVTEFGTPDGRALTQAIQSTQASLGLDALLGCSPQTYGIFKEAGMSSLETSHQETSLWHLYLQEMLPRQVLAPMNHNNDNNDNTTMGEPLFVSGSGALRYTLFEGPVTVNDVIAIFPFNNSIHQVVAVAEENQAGGGEQLDVLPIYGWHVLEWLEAANEHYASVAEYGLPTFLLSTLPSSSVVASQEPNEIDPKKIYRLFATDYDAARLLSVLAVLKQKSGEGLFITGKDDKDISSLTNGRMFQSHLVCSESDQNECYYLTELWKDYIREEMPCDRHRQNHWLGHDFDASLVNAQILQPPLASSATSARVHSRMTPAQEDMVLANDQKAALILVAVAVAMIIYLLAYPPDQQEQQQRQVESEESHPQTTDGNGLSTSATTPNHRDIEMEGIGPASVQLIPLCRYNTGNLSEGSYGSI